jgi:acyl carrier protein
MTVTIEELMDKLIQACPDVDTRKLSGEIFFKDLSLDSMDMASFMLEIEESYGVKVSNDELRNLSNLTQLASLINKRSV